MILLADSGSTKTEWKVISDNTAGVSLFSSGINPYFLSGEEIIRLLGNELPELKGLSFRQVHFYGTGINSPSKEKTVADALSQFIDSGSISVCSDLLGAARSLCQSEQGIACIMGTGSNSCYYDGKRIVSNVAPLGYILGDEGGGAVLGRKLVSAVLKKQVPESIRDMFFDTYRLTPAEILENVYMKPFPNRFLGQFAKFISANTDIPEFREIVVSSFEDFIRRNILQYPEAFDLPVHFTGSIAFYFRPFLEELLSANNLNRGKITLTPIEDLIQYHLKNP